MGKNPKKEPPSYPKKGPKGPPPGKGKPGKPLPGKKPTNPQKPWNQKKQSKQSTAYKKQLYMKLDAQRSVQDLQQKSQSHEGSNSQSYPRQVSHRQSSSLPKEPQYPNYRDEKPLYPKLAAQRSNQDLRLQNQKLESLNPQSYPRQVQRKESPRPLNEPRFPHPRTLNGPVSKGSPRNTSSPDDHFSKQERQPSIPTQNTPFNRSAHLKQLAMIKGPNRPGQYEPVNHHSWNFNQMPKNMGTYRPEQSNSRSHHPQSYNQHWKHGPNQKLPPHASKSQEYLHPRLNHTDKPICVDYRNLNHHKLGPNTIPISSRVSRTDGTKKSQVGAPPRPSKGAKRPLNNRRPNAPKTGPREVNKSHNPAQPAAGSKSPTPSLEPASKRRKTVPEQSAIELETELGKERRSVSPQTRELSDSGSFILEPVSTGKSPSSSPNGKVEVIDFVIDTEPQTASKFAKDESKFSYLKQLAKTSHDLESSADGSS